MGIEHPWPWDINNNSTTWSGYNNTLPSEHVSQEVYLADLCVGAVVADSILLVIFINTLMGYQYYIANLFCSDLQTKEKYQGQGERKQKEEARAKDLKIKLFELKDVIGKIKVIERPS